MRIRYGHAIALSILVAAGAVYAGTRHLLSTGAAKRASPAASEAAVRCPPGLIDNREGSAITALPQCEGRSGDWYEFQDKASRTSMVFLPLGDTPDTPGAGRAVHAFGSCENTTRSDSVWGAGIGFDLSNPSHDPKGKKPYDALGRGFKGLRFKARAGISDTTRGAVRVVSVRFPDINTDPIGGRCTTCWDDYRYSVNLDTTWRTYTILWSDLVHVGNGDPNRPFAANAIFSVHWRFLPSDVFDLHVDDVEFVR
ncbi:MAG: hypothetical protein JW940_09800 [Polyangiaceae bacterium]|nr:hypothetical protein [Polyangiaceae bacterium]